MTTIDLAVVRPAGRGTARGERLIMGHLPCSRAAHPTDEPCGRDVYVVEEPGVTKIVSADSNTVMASGRDLMDAATELAEIHEVHVRVIDASGRVTFTVGAPALVA